MVKVKKEIEMGFPVYIPKNIDNEENKALADIVSILEKVKKTSPKRKSTSKDKTTIEELTEEFCKLQKEKLEIIVKKNNDYAKQDDVFSNFKLISEITGLDIKQVFMVFISVKIARLKELFTGKEVKNESIEDTLIDLSNYTELLYLYLKKEGK